METSETQPNSASTAGLEASLSSLNSNEHDVNADTQPSKWTGSSTNTSFTASPLASRDPSPARPMVKTTAARTSRPSASALSRTSSVHDPSPTRTKSSTVRSSTSRPQLNAATTPVLPPSSDPSQGAPQPRKPAVESSSTSPRWPISPRLKSPPPPPSLIKPVLPQPQLVRKHEPETPVINIQRSTPSPHPRSSEPSSQAPSDTDGEDYAQLPSGMRTPAPGPSGTSSSLETVQEVSQPNTPGPNLDMAIERLSAASGANEAASKSDPSIHKKNGGNSESGSDDGSVKLNTRRSSSVAPTPSLHSRQSSTALKFGKGHTTGETSSKHITVEEEEVDSIPRVALGLNPAGPSVNASLKTKQSTETIRPKKEKKKTRKQPPTGTASSKADIFEAKVASAVEEADSSDSDETFVYDSNPPDVSDRPRRYHSRTPSATSMVSQLDRNGLRSLHGLMDSSTGPNPAVKRSMKFANTYTGNGVDTFTVDEDGKGTGRSNAGSARGTGRHHHAGRWGRNAGAGSHLSLFDNESPFPNAARAKLSSSGSRPSSNPPSPRFPPPPRSVATNGNGKRQMSMVGRYDIDDTTTGADDERTPLLNVNNPNRSIRSTRSRRTRESRDLESSRAYRPRPSFLNRFASCLVLTVMLLLVITGAIGFMFATSQPLTHMELVKISNVLASEQELMMDITVRAHNPNIVVVSVDAADLEIFAKSPHAGTDSEWWRRPRGDEFEILDDPPNDPPPDMDKPTNHSAPNMRLGNVVNIDSPLNFEGSFFRAGNSMASAELRLARPGNDTDGGSERWERIIGDEFTLIVKGVLKYTLPLSQRIRSATVTAQTRVTPNSANDPTLRPPNGTNSEIGIS